VGWHTVTDTSLWVRHRANSVELRSDEYTIDTLRPDLEQAEPSGVLRVYLSAYVRWLEPTDPDDAGLLRLPTTVVIDTGIDQVRLDLDQAAARALTAALQRLSSPPRPNQHSRNTNSMRNDNLGQHDIARLDPNRSTTHDQRYEHAPKRDNYGRACAGHAPHRTARRSRCTLYSSANGVPLQDRVAQRPQ
jgi:hypothetical protein